MCGCETVSTIITLLRYSRSFHQCSVSRFMITYCPVGKHPNLVFVVCATSHPLLVHVKPSVTENLTLSQGPRSPLHDASPISLQQSNCSRRTTQVPLSPLNLDLEFTACLLCFTVEITHSSIHLLFIKLFMQLFWF